MLNLSPQRIHKVLPEERLYSLRAIRPPKSSRLLARWLLGISILFIIVLFLPWQQNIRGTGRVTALNPTNRPQTVEAVIAGRIQQWHVSEGEYVEKGDTIITISEVREKYFDPQLLTRLQEQLTAKENSIVSKGDKIKALERQIRALREGMIIKVQQAKMKMEAERVRFMNAENQFERNKKLFEAGNIPLTKFQEIEYKYQGSQADYINSQTELNGVEADFLDKISKAESDINNTQAELFEAEADVAKLRNEFTNMQIRSQQYQVLAPQSGIIVKALKSGLGETVMEGDAVCTIMPEASDLAVEMYIAAMNVPLIRKGSHVRLEFDGWPALQVSGWPSVSVGTFGGVVEVVDYVNTRPGEFRILVKPDQKDEAWPRQLRVGSGIKGWAMLQDVPIWYEIWRQLNGFPPSLYEEPLENIVEKKPKRNGKI